ncbi:MAG: ABC transporter permease subunit, partial [Thermomicrobium sp.]|nr:ABC transporter permease subunit [Thermomicrobium sp.]
GTSRQPALVSLWLQRSRLLAWLSDTALPPVWRVLERAMNSLLGEGTAASTPGQQTGSPTRRARSVRLLTFAGLGVVSVWGIGTLGQALLRLPIDAWAEIGRGTVLSFLRVTTALLITVAWTVPVGVAIGMNPRWAPRVQALLQLVASFPATALFPAVVLVVIALPGGSQLAALLLLLLGTLWYVLFNVIAGAMAIPNELREAAALAQLSGWQRWRLLILPGIYPSLVTGLITAAGGAWNATIVAEYVTFQGAAYSAGGLGSVIAASAEAGDYGLLFAATLTMVALVVTLNRVFWGRLYRLVSQRFRLD